jgi:hypothetical protein
VVINSVAPAERNHSARNHFAEHPAERPFHVVRGHGPQLQVEALLLLKS